MKMARVAIRRLESRAAFPEVDLARDAGFDHPLQRAVHGGAADPGILAPHLLEQIVRADVPLLAQEDVDDAIAFGGVLAPEGTKKGGIHVAIGELASW